MVVYTENYYVYGPFLSSDIFKLKLQSNSVFRGGNSPPFPGWLLRKTMLLLRHT